MSQRKRIFLNQNSLEVYSPLTVDARLKSRDVLEFLRQRSHLWRKYCAGKHQYSGSTESTEMLYLVNYAMLSQQCDLIEQLDATNQSNIMHAQIRKTIAARTDKKDYCSTRRKCNNSMHRRQRWQHYHGSGQYKNSLVLIYQWAV